MNRFYLRRPVRVWPVRLFVGILGLQSACAMGRDYERPKVAMPSSWLGAPDQSIEPNTTAEAQAHLVDVSWWNAFNDPILRQLIDESLRNNLDLQQAVSRVEQYQALYGVQRSQIGPAAQVGVNAGYGKNPLTQSLAAAGGGHVGGAGASFAATAYATWELDFWGRLRRLNEAALADYLATEEARQSTSLTLVSNIAVAYVELLRLKERALLAERTVLNFNQMLALYELQLSSGAGSLAPVATARAQVADAEATRYVTTMQYEQAEVGLSLLLGSPPRNFVATGQLENLRKGPEVLLGLPAELLARRPDVRQAEAALRSANAQVGATKAGLFPSLSITGLFGGSTVSLAHPGPRGSLMSLIGGGPSWALPIPFFGGMQAWHRYDASQASRTQSELAYRIVVLTALGDVNRAISARTGNIKVGEARDRQVTELNRALALATDRFRQGSTSFVEVTQAQNLLFSAELALIEVRAQQVSSFVALYRSLGEGWR